MGRLLWDIDLEKKGTLAISFAGNWCRAWDLDMYLAGTGLAHGLRQMNGQAMVWVSKLRFVEIPRDRRRGRNKGMNRN